MIALLDDYSRIKSKFSTYQNEALAECDLERAERFGSSYGRRLYPHVMSEAAFDKKLKAQMGEP